MALRIFTNLSSLNSQRALEINRSLLGSSIERIASGIRVNRASDVAALKQCSRNLNDGIAMVNLADGALGEQASILIRLRELSSQAATGTIGDTERATLNLEFSALRAEFDRIAATTEFNGRRLVDGTMSANSSTTTILQIGIDSNDANRINLNQELNLTEVTSSSLNFRTSSITSENEALLAMDSLTEAIDDLIDIRGRVGSVQNRLKRSFNNLQASIEGLTKSVSTIRDADLAEEFATLTQNQILVQAGSAMIGQANLIPQGVLTLLQ